jgi:DNA-directed RNA polymerase subunit RPC12/RpoP
MENCDGKWKGYKCPWCDKILGSNIDLESKYWQGTKCKFCGKKIRIIYGHDETVLMADE